MLGEAEFAEGGADGAGEAEADLGGGDGLSPPEATVADGLTLGEFHPISVLEGLQGPGVHALAQGQGVEGLASARAWPGRRGLGELGSSDQRTEVDEEGAGDKALLRRVIDYYHATFTVHYLYNQTTGAVDDFKIVLRRKR